MPTTSFRHISLIGMMLVIFFSVLPAASQATERPTKSVLRVAIKPTPPFVIQSEEQWRGLSLDLWEAMAQKMNQPFEYQYYQTIAEVLGALESGQADLVVGSLSVTSQREEKFDFTHAFFRGGPGIATHKQAHSVVNSLFSLLKWDLLKMLGIMLVVLMFFGFLMWLFERKHNPEDYDAKHPIKGMAQGFWWSAVTLTTVGYGEKAPVSLPGRSIALIWMFSSIILISSFTAAITSSVTLQSLETHIAGFQDLHGSRVGTVTSSTSSMYLTQLKVKHQTYPKITDAVDALDRGELDAVVYDIPVLKYLITQKRNPKLAVLPGSLLEENYAFVLAEGSSLREPINRILLKEINASAWQETQKKYFE